MICEPSIEELCNRAEKVLETSGKHRVIITIVGTPGSGKTTITTNVVTALNTRKPGLAVPVGMDGFHLSRTELQEMPNAELAVKFRGAPHTFDAAGVALAATRLHDNSKDILVPIFDHAKKDPVPEGLVIPSTARIVLFEGLYLHLKDEPWCAIQDHSDDTWFVEARQDIARERLAQRHFASGIVDSVDAGYERADFNDIPNGQYITDHSHPAALVILNN